MKKIEFIQRSENGGHPVPHEANRQDGGEPVFGHGEAVYVVSKRELMSLLYRAKSWIPDDYQWIPDGKLSRADQLAHDLEKEIDEILMEDEFVQREPDLPQVPRRHWEKHSEETRQKISDALKGKG